MAKPFQNYFGQDLSTLNIEWVLLRAGSGRLAVARQKQSWRHVLGERRAQRSIGGGGAKLRCADLLEGRGRLQDGKLVATMCGVVEQVWPFPSSSRIASHRRDPKPASFVAIPSARPGCGGWQSGRGKGGTRQSRIAEMAPMVSEFALRSPQQHRFAFFRCALLMRSSAGSICCWFHRPHRCCRLGRVDARCEHDECEPAWGYTAHAATSREVSGRTFLWWTLLSSPCVQ